MSPYLAFLALLVSPLAAQRELFTVLGAAPNGELGRVLRAVGDVNGDGAGDFAVSDPRAQNGLGSVLLISGLDGAVLRTFAGLGGPNVANLGWEGVTALGDVDGDSRGDYALGNGNAGPLDVFSGTGQQLYRLGPLPEFMPSAAPAGDVDGDSLADFAALIRNGSDFHLAAIRGVTGQQLAVSQQPIGSGELRPLGDVEGDARHELLHLDGNTAGVLGIAPPRLLRTIVLPSPTVAVEAADVAGDARNEIVAFAPPNVFVYESATGSLLRTVTAQPVDGAGPFGGGAVVGDLDGDGARDFAMAAGPPQSSMPTYNRVLFLSGTDGRLLTVWSGASHFQFGAPRFAAPGDVDGDAVPDLVLADPFVAQNAGAWQVVSCRILAATRVLSVNCTGGPFAPELGLTRPILGRNVVVAGRDAPPGSVGTVAISLAMPFATNMGAVGCDVYFDVNAWSVLHLPPPLPSWTFTLPLPNVPQLAGLNVALQAFYGPTNGPLGYDLTNGITARLGF